MLLKIRFENNDTENIFYLIYLYLPEHHVRYL